MLPAANRCLILELVTFIVVSSSLATRSTADYEPIVGQPHIDFVLPRIDNRQPVALSQFRGKKVLLIHFASW